MRIIYAHEYCASTALQSATLLATRLLPPCGRGDFRIPTFAGMTAYRLIGLYRRRFGFAPSTPRRFFLSSSYSW